MACISNKMYSVYEINQYIKYIMDSDFALNHIYMKGEVSNCKYHTSGHIYFTLKDEKSQIACVMFAGQRSGLLFHLAEGQSVIVFGNISVYERDGKYQFYADKIRLDGTGLLYERFEELKISLEEEGIFAAQYKKPIPFYAKTVGIVTAKTGAAIHDMINISSRRNPYTQLFLYPVQVQGEGAAKTIVSGIKYLDRMGLDVIIVGRGGGSIEDLWAFNEEIVARAIFECNTPIIAAVGHETDITIADYVADLRAPTPSAAAELAVCKIQDIFYRLDGMYFNMNQSINRKLRNRKNEWEKLELKLENKSPQNQIIQKRQYLIEIEGKLEQKIKDRVIFYKHKLALYTERMKGLSPLHKLSQGYAYVSDETGSMVKHIAQVEPGQKLYISVIDGEMEARIEKVTSGRKR